MKSRKVERAQEGFKREISKIIFEMKDPRVHRGLVSVVSTDVSNDCSFCKVYISSLNGIKYSKKICKILNDAHGYIQVKISDILKMRKIPKFSFFPNDSQEYAFKLGNLISKNSCSVCDKNNLVKISSFLKDNDNFAIYTHENPDGDAIASCTSLYLALRKIGKKVRIFYNDEVNSNFDFIDKFVDKDDSFIPENFICLDLSEKNRLGKFTDVKFDVCIDHHLTYDSSIANLVYVNKSSSSNVENIYDLLNEMKIEIEDKIATCIYVGIACDTGRFMFSNVNLETFNIMSNIFDKISNFSDINYKIFCNIPRNIVSFNCEVIKNFYYVDKYCISSISLDMMEKFGVKYSDLDLILNIPLKISGVEVGIIVKQKKENLFKVSIRSKNDQALEISRMFNGGGHVNASGFEIVGNNIEEVRLRIIKKLNLNS